MQISPEFEFPDERPTCLPLVGRIAAGVPIEAVEDTETLDLEQISLRPVGHEQKLKEHIDFWIINKQI